MYLSFGSATNNSLAIRSDCDGGNAALMSVIDDKHELAAFRVEGADLAVVPAAHDR